MNIHPLFVHFPIGILILYVIFEIVRIKLITKQPYYLELKAILVVAGTIAAYIAASTGDMAEELAGAGKNIVISSSEIPLVEIHAIYAITTVIIFSILSGSYVFEYLHKKHLLKIVTNIISLKKLSHLIQKISIILALAGLITITIAGALGASLVYGPDIDPVVRFIYDIFSPIL